MTGGSPGNEKVGVEHQARSLEPEAICLLLLPDPRPIPSLWALLPRWQGDWCIQRGRLGLGVYSQSPSKCLMGVIARAGMEKWGDSRSKRDLSETQGRTSL